jgi:serine phosphatase RsbU (regulator of sigma subunit)/ABC-type uncharacterized transport system substrate-binding protein
MFMANRCNRCVAKIIDFRLAAWLLCLCFAASAFAGSADDGQGIYLASHSKAMREEIASPKNFRILVLNSYNKGYAWTDNEVDAIEDAFGAEPHVVLQMEYMDAKLINSDEHFRLLEALYANKYSKARFDVIIATDDDALDFLRQRGARLFPGVPIVFCGINDFLPSKIAGMSNVTGVNEQVDFASNLELIQRLQPDTKRINVITDELTAGRMIRKEFEAVAERYSDRFRFRFLSGLSMNQLKANVATLGEEDVVFYLTFFRDATGKTFTPWEAISLIAESSSVPLYGQVDYMAGKGVMGGLMKNSYYQGQVAAKLAHRILAGERAADIPIVMESPNYYMFDYLQLERFDIPLDALPAGSIIVNEPETFYYKYKKLIWSVAAIILFLIAFILTLLINIRKRQRAQQGLQDIIGAISSVLELGSTAEIKKQLVETIHRVIFLNKAINRVGLFNYAGDFKVCDAAQLTALSDPSAHGSEEPSSRALVCQSITEGRSVVNGKECVALFKSKSISSNVIYLKGQRRFDDMDRDLLEILTSNTSMALETLEKNKIQESLETARKIQLSMLPRAFAPVAAPFDVDIYAELISAKEVGGDLYDVFSIDEDYLCLAVGDVSDKGVPAALFMAMAKTLIRSDTERTHHPHEILHKVNNELSRDNEQCMFLTLFLAVLERKTRILHYANGGHNPPYVLSADGGVKPLPLDSGTALGVFEDAIYQPQSLQLHVGDGLFVYTDGVTEAMNQTEQLYGEERLEQLLQQSSALDAHALTGKVIEEVGEFAKGAGQSDDITVLFIRAR